MRELACEAHIRVCRLLSMTGYMCVRPEGRKDKWHTGILSPSSTLPLMEVALQGEWRGQAHSAASSLSHFLTFSCPFLSHLLRVRLSHLLSSLSLVTSSSLRTG